MFSFIMTLVCRKELDFDSIYEKYVRLVLYVANQILEDDELAKDAAQETFIRIYNSLWKLKANDIDKLKDWVCVIANNVAVDIYRKHKRYSENLESIDNQLLMETIESLDYSPLDQLTLKELSEEVLAIVQSFDEIYRNIVLMRHYFGFNNDEIAVMLNMPASTVGVRLHRAKKMILDILAKRQKGGCYNEQTIR